MGLDCQMLSSRSLYAWTGKFGSKQQNPSNLTEMILFLNLPLRAELKFSMNKRGHCEDSTNTA